MPRDKDDEQSQTQTQQAAPAAAAPEAGNLPPPQVEAQAGLPAENPPVPTDYCQIPCTWWNGGEVRISNGQTVDFPLPLSPPARGHGLMRNQIIFAFDIVSGSVSAVIGVSNPSEYNRPMKPWVGAMYPSPTIALHAGQRVHLHRIDVIDQSMLPADIRSWQMNEGMNGGSGRGAYPSLSPNVTAVNGDAVITNISVEAFAIVL